MKKFAVSLALLVTPIMAQASDLPSKKEPPAPSPIAQPALNWNGPYIGIIGGYGQGSSSFNDSNFVLQNLIPASVGPNNLIEPLGKGGTDYNIETDGWLVGGVVGYDVQLTNGIVLGVVGDISWANLSGSTCVEISGPCNGDPDDSYANGKIDMFATARARVGYAMDNVLVYATGGLAYASTSAEITNVFGDGSPLFSANEDLWGWAIGGGLELKLNRNMSIGVEYLHADFGKNSYDFVFAADDSISIPVDVTTKVDLVRASLNYRF